MIYRLTKYIILILIFLVLIISGSLFIITKIYSEEIKELALEKINQQLTSPIIVENIELSAFTHFPSISLEFKNVLINDPIIIDDTLLHSNKAYLNFDLYDLINKRYIVRKLVFNKGTFNTIQ
jgi:AsmA protein